MDSTTKLFLRCMGDRWVVDKNRRCYRHAYVVLRDAREVIAWCDAHLRGRRGAWASYANPDRGWVWMDDDRDVALLRLAHGEVVRPDRRRSADEDAAS